MRRIGGRFPLRSRSGAHCSALLTQVSKLRVKMRFTGSPTSEAPTNTDGRMQCRENWLWHMEEDSDWDRRLPWKPFRRWNSPPSCVAMLLVRLSPKRDDSGCNGA